MSFEFVSLDVETANSSRASICSIGLAKFQDGKLVDTFYSLINPEEEFSEFNTRIHGISQDDIINAPTFPQLQEEIISFIDDNIVVAHFAQFDMGVLKSVYQKYDLEIPKLSYICSYRLAKQLIPNQLSYKLKDLSKNFDIALEHHNALSDAVASGEILSIMLERSDKNDLQSLLEWLGYDRVGLLGQYGFSKTFLKSYTKNAIYQPTEDEIAKMNPNHYLYSKHICFTGKLEQMTRNEANKIVALIGAVPEKSVTKQTEILVVGEQDWRVVGEKGLSSKMKKAQQLLENGQEIEILTESDFIKLLED